MSMFSNRNQIIGVRATRDFVRSFDELSERLGKSRSEVIRYCLKRFHTEHFNNPDNFNRVKADMF